MELGETTQATGSTSKNTLKSALGGLALAIAGAAVGLAVAAVFYWDKLGFSGAGQLDSPLARRSNECDGLRRFKPRR